MARRHISFYGWVQGVGFRYRARHAAELYGCTGWVRNEWDGSVTMEQISYKEYAKDQKDCERTDLSWLDCRAVQGKVL